MAERGWGEVGGGSWWLGMGTHKGFAGQGKESSDYAGASESHNWFEVLLSILQCKTAVRPSFTTDHSL